MKIRFYIDPETDQPHIFKHDVTEEEVEDVCHAPDEDQRGRDGTFIARGIASNGKPLKVIYSRGEDGIFVITAYRMTGNELKAFRRRRIK